MPKDGHPVNVDYSIVHVEPDLRAVQGEEDGVVCDLGGRLASEGQEVKGQVVPASQLAEVVAGQTGEGRFRRSQDDEGAVFCDHERGDLHEIFVRVPEKMCLIDILYRRVKCYLN